MEERDQRVASPAGFGNQTRVLAAALLAVALLGGARGARAEVVAIVGGKVIGPTGKALAEATVVIDGERIRAVGKGVRVPEGARIIDARGKWVYPGFIESHTQLGLIEVSLVPATRDEDEGTDPTMPHMRVIDAINPASALIPVTRINGVTTALCVPGEGDVLTGQSALIDLDGETVDAMVVKFPVAVHASLGEPPKARFGPKNQSPQTRMGTAAVLREALVKAQDYQRKLEAAAKPRKKKGKEDEEEKEPPARDLELEALLPVLKRDLPLIVRAHRMDDILTALRIADEFGLRLVLDHATEGYKVADELARRKIPVLVGPITTQPGSMETLGAIYENAALLYKAGVLIAIQSGETHNVRNLPYEAGLAVTYGLPWEEALKAITINPARIFGVDDRLGSIEEGKIANLVVADGDPFQPQTRLEHVFIAGREIPLTSYQTELYERYKR